MRFILRCRNKDCRATFSSGGSDDPDTNGCEIDDIVCPECGNESDDVVDVDYDDDYLEE